LCCAAFGFTADAITHSVSDAAALDAALKSAQAGDVVELVQGNYGSVVVSGRNYTGYVTVRSENTDNKVLLTGLNVLNSSYIEFNSIVVARTANDTGYPIIVDASSFIRIVGCEVRGPVDNNYSGPRYGLYIRNGCSNIRVEGCHIHNVLRGTFALGASNIEYVNNLLDYLGEDGIDYSSVDGLLIENNEFGGHFFQQVGGHMDFIQGSGGESNNIIIRGNVMICRNAANVQGIFMKGPDFNNVVVEQNILYTGMGNGIRIYTGSNVVVRYNTVLHADGTLSANTVVANPGQKYGNVYTNATAAVGNLTIPFADDLNAEYAKYFATPLTTAMNENYSVVNFLPKAGSETDSPEMGAYVRIHELLGDTEPPIPTEGEVPALSHTHEQYVTQDSFNALHSLVTDLHILVDQLYGSLSALSEHLRNVPTTSIP